MKIPSSLMEGRLPETILKDGARSCVPRCGANRNAGRSGPRPPGFTAWRGQSLQAPVPLPGQASWVRIRNRHGGAPREVPVAPGQGGRASQARPKERVRLSALHPPLIGGTELLLSRRPLAPKPPWGPPADAKSEGTCEEADKPGRSNAPRER